MKSNALPETPSLYNVGQPQVTLSRWVNEPLPDVHNLLCARDVARLTRRPTWMVIGMSWCGLFPRPRRYRGRRIGWLKSDVLEAMTEDLHTLDCQATRNGRQTRKGLPRQGCLPLDCRMPGVALRPPRVLPSRKSAHSCRAAGERSSG